MTNSVSSSPARSGEVEDDDSDGASLGKRAACRERGICMGAKGRANREKVTAELSLDSRDLFFTIDALPSFLSYVQSSYQWHQALLLALM